ncbi:MAG: YhcH/YjgK/YiaL family protein [Candidatus Poribacteria bacterium]|nr:YhcH/YjgK/YiaL family protein [Candidatus Poribacteria bacterium]
MILDRLENASRYFSLHPGFEMGFDFLKQHDLAQLKVGQNEIAGERLYAMAVRAQGKGKNAAIFEAHRKYIDIQFTVSGSDDIGWESRDACEPDNQGYNAESDVQLYSNSPALWVTVPQGYFAIFFPEDVHAPMGTDEAVDKVVVKVAVDWDNTQ